MIKGISIHIENEAALQELFSLASRVSGQQISNGLPNTSNALYVAALSIENAWKGWANGEQLPGVKNIPRPNSEIRASIKKTPDKPQFSDYTIYSDNPYMSDLQNGKDEIIDMKAPGSPWLTGKKSRLNKKDGSPYLIVPFSWGVPGKTGGSAHFRNVVPKGITVALERRGLSKRLSGRYTEPNARGENIARDKYKWGGRIAEDEAQHVDSGGNLTGYDVGMVRMWDSSYGEDGNHGTYFTFRVISAKAAANKWIQRRHIEPHDVTGALKKAFEDMIQQTVNEALRADIGF